MILPGKLTIGFLQEDNPQKFFFRVSPLIIKEENGYQVVEDARQEFLEDGFIRIVPDKNEMSHFKTRMRSLGRYCLLDLRRHTGENDKIRPNKNHAGENGDRNAFIVYSDVVARINPRFMAEAVAPDQDGLFPVPGTPLVAVMQDGQVRGIYAWANRSDAACIIGNSLTDHDLSGAAAQLVTVTVDDAPVQLLLNLGAWGVAPAEGEERIEECAVPDKPAEPPRSESAEAPAPRAAAPEAEKPADKPVERVIERDKPADRPADRPSEKSAPRAASPESEKTLESAPKPWLQHTTYVFPRVVASSRLSPRAQSLQQQSGFNPHRSASIKDVIDDMWRQSRLDQLGHPVPSTASAEPVVSPIDKAMQAVREAWALPEARASLISSLLKLDDLDSALGVGPAARQARDDREREQALNRLEADRLKVLCEIDELKKMRADKRAELVSELKRSHAAEMAQLDKKNAALREAGQRYAAEAASAQKAAETAEKAFKDVLSGDLNDQLAHLLAEGRARDLMVALAHAADAPAALPETENPSAGELITDIRVRFDEAGYPLTNDEAVNLLACLTLGRIVIFSGANGSGKSERARTLAAALGIAAPECGRFVEMQPDEDARPLASLIGEIAPSGVPVVRRPELKRVLEAGCDTVPALLMIDDANRAPVERTLGALLSQLDENALGRLQTGLGAITLNPALRLLLTLQDASEGACVDARLLDRAFMIRLAPERADTPWQPRRRVPPRPEKAVSMATLKAIFKPDGDVPGEIVERMKALREKLAGVGVYLSRRALDDMYAYCAAVSPLMTASPLEVLDYAFAQRAMPTILASAGLDALHALPSILPDMPRSLSLLLAPLPLPAI